MNENKQLKEDIKEHQSTRRFPFWSVTMALMSIFQGEFISRVDGYLVMHSEPYISSFPEGLVGWILITLGVIKLIALLRGNTRIANYTLWGMSFIWTGLFLISFTYSFGTGFPNPAWYFYGLVTIIGYRVALIGGY